MPKWTFSGSGGHRTVEASNETEARHLAMVARWGQPGQPLTLPEPHTNPKSYTRIGGHTYLGDGLDLIKVK